MKNEILIFWNMKDEILVDVVLLIEVFVKFWWKFCVYKIIGDLILD